MIASLAVLLGIPPSVLWEEDPKDLATIIAVLGQTNGQ